MFGLFGVVGGSVVFVLVFYCWFGFVGWFAGTGVAMVVLFCIVVWFLIALCLLVLMVVDIVACCICCDLCFD